MENTSGIVPVDMRVLVKPDAAQTKIGSIELPDAVIEQKKYAGTKATFVLAGANAFSDWGDTAAKPKPGDRVHFAQYSGARLKGEDGEDYVIMKDEDLTAIIEVAP